MTHPPHTIESTVDARWHAAWTEACRTSEGRQEYWRRFGDYLFTDREIPRELLSHPPAALRPKATRRQQHKPDMPGGLKTAAQAAAKLGCSIKTLKGHVAAGALKYVVIGHGTKRPRRYFTDADLDQFIANQTREDIPSCPSSKTRAHHIGASISNSKVIAFTAAPKPRPGAKPKK